MSPFSYLSLRCFLGVDSDSLHGRNLCISLIVLLYHTDLAADTFYGVFLVCLLLSLRSSAGTG